MINDQKLVVCGSISYFCWSFFCLFHKQSNDEFDNTNAGVVVVNVVVLTLPQSSPEILHGALCLVLIGRRTVMCSECIRSRFHSNSNSIVLNSLCFALLIQLLIAKYVYLNVNDLLL